jgi:hypothetical protein
MLQQIAKPWKYYICANYSNSGGKKCSTHSIPQHEIEDVILREIQAMTTFAREHEQEFVTMLRKKKVKVASAKLRAVKNEHTRIQRRMAELDIIIPRTYEDNVLGRLSDERFTQMHARFEAEQATLQARAEELATILDAEVKQEEDTERFLKLVREYSAPEALTAEIARAFIDKIIVHAAEGRGKDKTRKIEICYNFVGFVEEMCEDKRYLSNAM